MVRPGHLVSMRPRHLWYDQCINGGVAWLCKRSFLPQYSAIPRGQDSQLQVQDHAYTIIIGAKDGLYKIHVQSRSQLLSCLVIYKRFHPVPTSCMPPSRPSQYQHGTNGPRRLESSVHTKFLLATCSSTRQPPRTATSSVLMEFAGQNFRQHVTSVAACPVFLTSLN